jgi:hypothetical protein
VSDKPEKKKPGVFDVRDAVAKILVEQNRIERLEANAVKRADRAETLLRKVASGEAGADEARKFFGDEASEP